MSDAAPPRPPAVLLACVAIGAVAVLAAVEITSALSSWGSLGLQESVRAALQNSPFEDASLDSTLTLLQRVLQGLLVVLIALVVLAIYVARGDRVARTVLSALVGLVAVALALTGLAGLLPAMALGFALSMLWTPESRLWFDERNGRTPPEALVAKVRAREQAIAVGRPVRGTMPPLYREASAHGFDRPEAKAVPSSVTSAAIIMLVSSLLVATVVGSNALLALVRLADPAVYREVAGDRLVPGVELLGLTEADRTLAIMAAVSAALALVALAGAACAVALLLGRRRAAALAVILSGIAVIGSAAVLPAGLPIMVAGVVSLVLLRSPAARAWRSATPPRGGPPVPPPPPR